MSQTYLKNVQIYIGYLPLYVNNWIKFIHLDFLLYDISKYFNVLFFFLRYVRAKHVLYYIICNNIDKRLDLK